MAEFIEESRKEIITPSGYYESTVSKCLALCFPESMYRTKENSLKKNAYCLWRLIILWNYLMLVIFKAFRNI